MDEQQIQALQEALEEFRKNGELSAEALDALTKKVDPATKAFNKVESTLKSFANGIGRAANDLTKVNGGFTNLNGSIDAVSGGINAVAKEFGIAGKAVGLVAQAIGGYAKFVMNQLNDVSKMYDSLGDISAVGARGVTDLQQMFASGGLATANMENFAKALAANSQGIASFGSGMSQGAERFKEVAAGLTSGRTAERFLALGIGVDAVTTSAAQFVAMQTRNGGMLNRTNSDVIKTTREYIEQIDLLARMTGNTRAQQEEEAKKSQANARFRAVQAELNAQGLNNQSIQLQLLADSLGGDVGDAVRDISAFGVSTTKQSAEVNMLSRDMVRSVTMAVKRGEMTAAQGAERIQEGLAAGGKTFQNTIKAVGNDLTGWSQALDARALVDIRDQLSTKLGRRITLEEMAADTQGTLLKTLDKQTQEFVKSRLNIAEAGKNVKTLQMALAMNAIPAVDAFSGALNGLTEYINKNILKITPPGPKGVEQGPGATLGGRRSTPAGTIGDTGLKGAAAKNLNPGNLRFIGQAGAVEGTGGFAKFETLEAGYEALAKDLYAKLTGKSSAGALKDGATVAKLISVYAPPNENDTQAYINNVSKYMNLDPNAPLVGDPKTLAKLMVAVLGQENLGDPSKVSVAQKKSIQMAVAQTLAMKDVIPLNEFQKGGISTGPNTGYSATLHGTEAVIPLPDGKTIPVTLSGYNEMMTQQIGQLDELISIMRNQVDISGKILRAQQ